MLERARGYLDAVYEPETSCDCRFLRHVMRLTEDGRVCHVGRGRTLDQCHECGAFVFDETPADREVPPA